MAMAMAMRSCSNSSFSSFSTKLHLCISSHSSSNHTCATLHPDTFTLPTTGILQLAGAAAPPLHKLPESESDAVWRHQWCRDEATTRRKRRRRRKRRNAVEWMHDDDDDDDDGFVFAERKSGKSRFMTPKEEAKFSWYLKERARVEAVRTRLEAEMGGNELSSTEWAKAAGISRNKLDKILWNGRESEKRITSCYQGLVLSIASSYLGKGLTLQDLAQEGSIGLLRGAIKFDPQKGYKLSTYAYWWIRQAITRAVASKSKIIRLPGSINELMPKICEANNALSRELGRLPTYEEIAEAIDANTEAVRLASERSRSLISLDKAMTSQGYMSLQDIIPGPDELTPEEMMKKELVRPQIGKLLEALSEREARILSLHYRLNGDSVWSFEEIGKVLKLSRERVRQINTAALCKLREASEMEDLNYFI